MGPGGKWSIRVWPLLLWYKFLFNFFIFPPILCFSPSLQYLCSANEGLIELTLKRRALHVGQSLMGHKNMRGSCLIAMARKISSHELSAFMSRRGTHF